MTQTLKVIMNIITLNSACVFTMQKRKAFLHNLF